MLHETDLSKTERIVPFPYQVLKFGHTESEYRGKFDFYFEDHIEICIRITSTEMYAEDFIEGQSHRMEFPHVFIKKPFVPFYNFISAPRKAVHFIYPLSVMQKLEKDGLLPENIHWKIDLTSDLTGLLHKLRLLQKSYMGYGNADRIDLCCFQIFQELLLQQDAPRTRSEWEKEKIMNIASAMKYHFNEPFDLNEILSEQGLSRRTFFRYWGRYFRESPMQYLHNIKMKEAEELLCSTGYSVSRISELLGFSDVNWFIKKFRNCYGCTPLQYRKNRKV